MSSTSQMNIKSPDARRLADELSSMTGRSVTQVVTEALREKLERERSIRGRKGMAARLLSIGREYSGKPVVDPREPDDMLYDVDGLPKE